MPATKRPHCRIGRVRLHGGADLRIYRNDSGLTPSAMCAALPAEAQQIADDLPGMRGYVVLAWDHTGRYNRAVRSGNGSPVTDAMLPAFAGDILRMRGE